MAEFLKMPLKRTIKRSSSVAPNVVRPALAIFLALILSAHTPLFGESQLSEKSPFLPPGYGQEETKPAEPVVQPQGPISREIEFRGIAQIGGVYQFSIFNKKEQKGYWLKENEREDGISVSSFDDNASTVVILMNGRSERLTLMSATETPMPVAQASPGNKEQARPPGLPAELNRKSSGSNNRKVVPRRRVILPKKN